jgi:hypothetical protein
MYVFYAPALMPNVVRAPGPYRQVFVAGQVQAPMPGYELKIDDFSRGFDTAGSIGATWDLLEVYQLTGGNSSVEIAIASFNRSYGFQLRPASRTANLFTALDAMLGGMSAWKIGRVPIKPRGYARRVEAALRCAAGSAPPHDDARELARWLNSERGGRGLRNAIAHTSGREVEDEAQRAHDRLQGVVRALLRQYVHFSTIWAHDGEASAARLGIAMDSPPAAAYVTTLEAEARQRGAMADLLCVPSSAHW